MRTSCLIALLAGLGGCGPAAPVLAPVAGTVTAAGRPLRNVEVVFVPEPGTPGRDCAAYTDTNGRYYVPHDPALKVGVPVGTHRVLLRDADLYLVPPAAGVDPESGEPTRTGPAVAPGRKTSRVPPRYGESAQTPLRGVRVEPGQNTLDIAVEPQ